MNDSKFHSGFLLGLLIGGGAVFLFGTKTGRNLVKIVSERGMDGIVELLEEYNLEDLGEESFDSAQDLGEPQETEANEETNHQTEVKPAPKKHFFKRVRK